MQVGAGQRSSLCSKFRPVSISARVGGSSAARALASAFTTETLWIHSITHKDERMER